MEIKRLIKNGESETVEFKKSFDEECLEAICALANAHGGTILIGVSDDGTVCGVQIGKKTLEDWAHRIQDALDPSIQPSIDIAEEGSKKIGVIKIQPNTNSAVNMRGRFLKRVGRSNQSMNGEEIAQRLVSSRGLSWDAGFETGASISDLDSKSIADFVGMVRSANRRPIPKKCDDWYVLDKLELVAKKRPTRAAILLFAKNPQSFIPSAYLQVGRFRSPTEITDEQEFRGSLISQIERCMGWFKDRLATEWVISGKPQRDVIWEYPLEAIREAVTNAVCHRDYKSDANIQIRLYDDRLEFSNPGGLASSLTASDLFKDHNSVPRNRRIAEAFFNISFIEKWGTGTIRIAAELKKAGMPKPEFDTKNAHRFQLIFRKEKFNVRQLAELGFNPREIKAVTYISKGKTLNNNEYQELFSVSKSTATRELRNLLNKGFIKRRGQTGFGTYYELTD